MMPRNMDASQEPNNRSFATFHQQVLLVKHLLKLLFLHIWFLFTVIMVRSRTITTWTFIRTTTWPWCLRRRNVIEWNGIELNLTWNIDKLVINDYKTISLLNFGWKLIFGTTKIISLQLIMLKLLIWLHENYWICNLHDFHLTVGKKKKTQVTVFSVVKIKTFLTDS